MKEISIKPLLATVAKQPFFHSNQPQKVDWYIVQHSRSPKLLDKPRHGWITLLSSNIGYDDNFK